MVEYVSTRGAAPRLKFLEATLAGLARDGGLYVPEDIQRLPQESLAEMARLSYRAVAARVIQPFAGDDIPAADLARLLEAACKNFTHAEIAPLRELRDGFFLLELFHGPTLAFKDIAMQFLGQVFDYILARRGQKATIVGATSGDTGAAAIAAFRGSRNADIFILHPHGRVSEVQRRQMTTVDAPNVFNVAIEGSFDDCQDLVKTMFNDAPFRDEMRLSAVNSINWGRIVAQAVYYVSAAARLGGPAAFCVPTGNFGNVYAGYIARAMGAPVEKLIVATNRNDILHRFFETGEMKAESVAASLSPSMDIQISSNFERLLFDLYDRDGAAVGQTMKRFRETGAFRLDASAMARLKPVFSSGRTDDARTRDVIRETYRQTGCILDPHTAVGVGVAEEYRRDNPGSRIVTLATAHPAKFPDVVRSAIGFAPELPPFMADLYRRPETYAVLPADLAQVQRFVRERVSL